MHSFFLHNALSSTTQNSPMVVPRTVNLKYKHRLHFRPSESQPLGDGPRNLFFPLTWIFCFLNFLFENIKCYKVKLVQKNQMSMVELAQELWEHSSQHSRRVAQQLTLAPREPMPSPGLHRHLHSEPHSPPHNTKLRKPTCYLLLAFITLVLVILSASVNMQSHTFPKSLAITWGIQYTHCHLLSLNTSLYFLMLGIFLVWLFVPHGITWIYFI